MAAPVCIKCQKSIIQVGMLTRTKSLGGEAGWMCDDCLETNEPELFKNNREPEEFELLKDLIEILK